MIKKILTLFKRNFLDKNSLGGSSMEVAIFSPGALKDLCYYYNKSLNKDHYKNEIGGHCEVKVIRRKMSIFWIKALKETSIERNPASAIIRSSSPFIWHVHPKGYGARPSSIDKSAMESDACFQAISINGYPPLYVIACPLDLEENETAFTSSGLVIYGAKGQGFEIKCYSLIPSIDSFEVEQVFDRSINNYDSKEGVLFEFGPVCYELLMETFRKSNYLHSVCTLIKGIKGIYSPGLNIDTVDLIRILGLQNTLVRFGIPKKDILSIFKIDAKKEFQVRIKDDVKFEKVDLKVAIIPDDIEEMVG